MCSQADDPSQHVSDDTLRAALDPDVEKLADLFMDLRLDGPAADGWTYQQTARHYARIILGRWLAGIRQDPTDALAASATDEPGLRAAYQAGYFDKQNGIEYDSNHGIKHAAALAASATDEHVHSAACHSENCLGRDHD